MDQQQQVIEYINNDIHHMIDKYNKEAKRVYDEIVSHYNTRGNAKKFLEFRYKKQIASHQEYYEYILPDVVVDCAQHPSLCRHYGCVHDKQHRHILGVDEYMPGSTVISSMCSPVFDYIALFCKHCANVHYFQELTKNEKLVSVTDLMEQNGHSDTWDVKYKSDTNNNLSDNVLKYIVISVK